MPDDGNRYEVLNGELLVTLGKQPSLRTKTWRNLPRPALVIEVLSPGSERYDLGKKREAYLAIGIAEYWLVDIEEAHIDVFRPGMEEPMRVAHSLVWAPADAPKPLEIDVARLLS